MTVGPTGFRGQLDVVHMKEESGMNLKLLTGAIRRRGSEDRGVNKECGFGHTKLKMMMNQEKMSSDIC